MSQDQIGFIRNSRLPNYSNPFPKRQVSTKSPYRRDFNNYLRVHGVIEFITKYLHRLMKEMPENPIEKLQENKVKDMEIEELKRQLAEANEKIEELQVQNKRLKQEQN